MRKINTFYTKCNREFQKNSTAVVTGYEIKDEVAYSGDVRPAGRIIDDQCRACPFVLSVKEGWPPVHKRWECRAGSEKPNHTTEWTGSLEDKNTIQIHSLDHQLLEKIKDFCENHSDLGAGYNADHMADCRRTLAINCSSNKKGIAAKKELIEKFFPNKLCSDCFYREKAPVGEDHPMQWMCWNADHRDGCDFHFDDNNDACSNFKQKESEEPFEDTACCENCNWSEDWGESVEYIKCAEGKRRKDVRKKQKPCANYIPANNFEPEVFDEQKCRICGCTDSNACDGGCYWVEDDLCSACAGSEEGLFYCDKDDCPFNDRESGCQFDPEEHRDEQWEDDIETAVNRCACENDEVVKLFNQIVEDTAIEVSEKENTCDGCSYVPVKGKDTCNTIYVNQKATEKCGWYNNPKTGEMGDLLYKLEYGEDKPIEKEEETVSETKENVIETPENVTELTETASNTLETVTFDYTSVDSETADFLQDKAEKIATIRMRSVMAIGKELKEAHEKLANNKTGTFGAWVNSIGISRDKAENYIRAFNYIAENIGNIESAEQIQPSLLFAISKPSAPQELQNAVLAGDITTHKEYQELLKAKENAEFHEKNSRESYKRLEKVNTEHYQKRVQAEEKIQELQAQINALSKSKTDPNEILMLKNTIKQYEDQVYELNQQLFSTPIEAQAVTIKEVVPPEVQAELQRLTTENRLLSEKQTSTTKVIESIVQGSAEIRGQLQAYNAITKSEIQEMKEIPKTVIDAVYSLITDLKLYTLNFESLTKQFRGGEGG